MQTVSQRTYYFAAVISILTLIALCTAWELVLAPLRPGGSWLVLKVVPLLVPLRGILKRDVYTLQWSSMLILLYFAEGIVRATTDKGLSSSLGWIEAALVLVYFTSTLMFLRPYKLASKRLAKQAIEKASE